MKTFKGAGAQPSATQIQSNTHHGGETTAPSVTLCLRAAWQPAPAICLWSKRFGCCAFLLWCGATVLGFSLTFAVISLCKHVCPLPQLAPLLLLLLLSPSWQTWHFGTEAQTSGPVGYELVLWNSNSLSRNSDVLPFLLNVFETSMFTCNIYDVCISHYRFLFSIKKVK